MKRTLLILFVLSSILKAQTDYRLDTLMCRYIGPGTVYTRIKASAPWDIYVLRIDLKNPYIKVESIKAKDRYAGRELVSSMAARKSTEGHFALGAVNGDFYDMSNGKTCNIQIENGEIIRTPASKISTIGFSSSNKPMLNFVSYSGAVIASNGVSNRISNVNESRGTDQLILYNSYMGDATGTNSYGTEVLVRPVTAWGANDTVKCVVEKIQNGSGNMQLTPSYAVLSGNGTSASFLSNNLKLGDTVKLYQSVTPGLSKLTQMIGGYPKIVYKGLNFSQQGYFDEGGPDHYANLDPRTGAGFSYDSTYLYLVALDGFENGSAGATLNQLADVMISLGVCNGINLDGGGSTTMYVRGAVVNKPSDGTEREDANALAIFSSAPTKADSLKRFAFLYNYPKFKIYSRDSLNVNVYGNDKYENPVKLDSSLIKYSLSAGLGTIDKNGLFIASKTAQKGYLYAKYGSFSDSTLISITPISKLSISPKNSLIDAAKNVQLSVKGIAADNAAKNIAFAELTMKSTDTSVAVVSADGILKGKKDGKAKIIATFVDGVADTMDVTVQIGRGVTVIDKMDNLSSWTLDGSRIDTSGTKLSISSDYKTEGQGSLKLDYKYNYLTSTTSSIYLYNTLPLYGLPDSVFVDVMAQDSSSHKISLVIQDDASKSFTVNTTQLISSGSKFTTIPFSLNLNLPASVSITYPIKLLRVVLQLGYNDQKRISGQTYSGTIYFDNLRLKYPLGPTSAVSDKETEIIPKEFSLKQNYPNPFNPSTIIEFATTSETKDLTTTLKVYDLLGREVATLLNQRLSSGLHKVVWNAGNMPSGVYFYRLQSGNCVETKKMMLVR